ncbi:4-hydroxy-2-oxoheptanedioate aldolase [Conyzicola lurida]|uniref:4-hydroxy-2-oxoheptanedioate aldolase n=1 Tax=Conyzicola lurida TaxID=1172621 RepID=A0A841AE07_9MICO|nr:4-hydroxy-2-oxoheptanedioate aldolase [Conyzicola lurida]
MTTVSKLTESRGAWMMLGEPGLTARIAGAGFDWILLDQQHGAIGPDRLVGLARAHDHGACELAVRVPSADPAAIGRALDVGASIVVVPLVQTADEARAIVAAANYPPVGGRSWGPLTPLWGAPTPDAASAKPRLWPMIETRTALDQLDEILAVEGLDAVFIGPYDLSLALGMTLAELLADDRGPLATIVAACRKAGVACGAFAGSPANAKRLAKFGFGHLAVTTDLGIIDAGTAFVLPGWGAPRTLY